MQTISQLPRIPDKVPTTGPKADRLIEVKLVCLAFRTISPSLLIGWHRNVVSVALQPFGWYPSDRIVTTVMELGLTNQMYLCELDDENISDENKKVVVRVYGKGSEDMVDREQEIVTMIQADERFVKACFGNGVIIHYFPGRCLGPADLPKPDIQKKIAQRLAELHKIQLRDANGDVVKGDFFSHLLQWVANLEKSTVMSQKIIKIGEDNVTVKDIRVEAEKAKAYVASLKLPYYFSHGDINGENCIVDFETENVAFIDFEYTKNFFRGFDIGNHFCEYAGCQTNLNFAECYPRKSTQLLFLGEYFRALFNAEPSSSDLEEWYFQAKLGAQLSHLFWSVWGLLQMERSSIEYDFEGYAVKRLSLYWAHRKTEPDQFGVFSLDD